MQHYFLLSVRAVRCCFLLFAPFYAVVTDINATLSATFVITDRQY